MKRVYYAPETIPNHHFDKLIFLAGPIQGATDWHKEAISHILDNSDAIIACPKRPVLNFLDEKFNYVEQVDWEVFHLEKAAHGYGTIFWLANPFCCITEMENSDRSYAQTTRFELAEWYSKYLQDRSIKLSVGIDPGFKGERYILKRFGDMGIEISNSLKNTCEKLLKK